MLSVEIAPYTLRERVAPSQRREGALLKIDFGGDSIGYSDCHLWPELGDPSLSDMLREIRSGNYDAPFFHAMLLNAFLDMQARSIKAPISSEEGALFNHYLITDVANIDEALLERVEEEGFKQLKVKVGKRPDEELKRLALLFGGKSPFALRLDFNARLARDEYLHMARRLNECGVAIEFCEDPFPYDFDGWCSAQEEAELSIAADRYVGKLLEEKEFPFIAVIKPAVDNVELLASRLEGKRFIVTSYLDHPVGQVAAAYRALELKRRFPENDMAHGLLSHYLYEENPYAEELAARGPLFTFPKGHGIGFDELLKGEKWTH